MEGLTLTDDELRELTGYRRGAEQLRELARMGIKAHRRRDGSVAVARSWIAAAAMPGAKSQAQVVKKKQRTGAGA